MIFFDFDGTIADVWPRYYQVFLAASGISGISLPDYVKAKRALVSDAKVARNFGEDLPAGYAAKKRTLLESRDYLRLDTLLVPAARLETFFSKFECLLLTGRRQAAAFLAELEDLGLGCLSNHCVALDPDRGISKKAFLEQNFSRSSHIIVGDSEAEWEAATLENVHAVLVRTGLRCPEDFLLTKRHSVVPSVTTFITAYMERGVPL